MKVLVTGAGGFVCRSIVHELLAAGHEVIALDRAFDADLRRDWAGRVRLIETDAHTLPPVEADALVHGAAITAGPEESGHSPEAHFRANTDPLLAALEWSRGRFIGISSGAVYAQGDGLLDETQPPTPDGLYAVAKSTMEALVGTLRRHYGRDALVIRLGNIYGPGEQQRPTRPRISRVGQMLHSARTAGSITLTQPDEPREWTYAPDVGRVVERLLTMPAPGHALYNVASGERLTDRDIAQAIQERLPHVTLNIHDENASDGRRGWLGHGRLQQDTGFDRWTPFRQGLAHIIEQERV